MGPGLFSRCIWKWRKKKTRRWSKTGKQMLTGSSSLCVYSSLVLHSNSSVVDWFILHCCHILDLGVHSGHPTESTGHLQLLPCQYLSDYRWPESPKHFRPFFSTLIYSTNVCRVDEWAVVSEPGDQYYLCSTCDVATVDKYWGHLAALMDLRTYGSLD